MSVIGDQQNLFSRKYLVLGFIFLFMPGSFAQALDPSAPLQILGATYEAIDGSARMDVTAALLNRVHNNTLSVLVGNAVFPDPAPYHMKQVDVNYAVYGTVYEVVVTDGNILSLPTGTNVYPSSPLQLIYAGWTALDGSGGRLVTNVASSILQDELAKGHPLNIFAGTSALGFDPALGHLKQLVIDYTFSGVQYTVSVQDGGWLTLTAPGYNPFQVVSALWSASDGSASADVTASVSALAGAAIRQNQNPAIVVGTAALGNDPAPGIPKELLVTYSINGVTYSRAATDGSTLLLPIDNTEVSSELGIVSATYRAQDGAGSEDATNSVAARISYGTVSALVAPEFLDIPDPAYGHVKELDVVYQLNGVRQTVRAIDGNWVTLPARANPYPGSPIQILNATWESLDGVGGSDVTNRVSALIQSDLLQDQPLSFGVNGTSLGVDPAYGHLKELDVFYQFQGVTYEAVAQDNTDLTVSTAGIAPVVAGGEDRVAAFYPSLQQVAVAYGRFYASERKWRLVAAYTTRYYGPAWFWRSHRVVAGNPTITYDPPVGTMTYTTPPYDVTYYNHGPTPDSTTYRETQTATQTASWSTQKTADIGLSLEATAPLPLIANGTVRGGFSFSSTHSHSVSTTKTFEISSVFSIPPFTKVVASVSVTRANFSQHWTGKIPLSGKVWLTCADFYGAYHLVQVDVGTVFSDCQRYNIISTYGYYLVNGRVSAASWGGMNIGEGTHYNFEKYAYPLPITIR